MGQAAVHNPSRPHPGNQTVEEMKRSIKMFAVATAQRRTVSANTLGAHLLDSTVYRLLSA